MRVLLDTGSKSVDLDSDENLYTWEKDEKFIKMVLRALESIGYSRTDIEKCIEGEERESY